jgi:hypothetical protein
MFLPPEITAEVYPLCSARTCDLSAVFGSRHWYAENRKTNA